MNKKESSYIDQLSSGYESNSVTEYDPAKTEGQIGKEFEEKVTTENWWSQDERLPMGIGKMNPKNSSFHEAAVELRKIARKLAIMDMDYSVIHNEKTASKDVMDYGLTIKNDLSKIAQTVKEIGTALEKVQKIAVEEHPSNLDPEPWLEESSSQMGDEEWIDIGTAKFDDPRDQVGKPLPQ